MDKDRAIAFLEHHQPMPDDTKVSQDLMNEYNSVREYFLLEPHEECIPLFLHSFGERDGYGVYQLVEDVLLKFDKSKVVRHLLKSLRSKHRSVRYWSAQISASFADKRLLEPLCGLLRDDDSDIRFAVITALSQIEDKKVLPTLKEALSKEKDEEVKEFLQEVIVDLEDKRNANRSLVKKRFRLWEPK